MEYDNADDWIDNLNDKLTGKEDDHQARIDRIDDIITNAYEEAMYWHNNKISEGADPRSGLENLPYIPWDERIDGVAATEGACTMNESSFERNGGHWRQYGTRTRLDTEARGGGDPLASCAALVVTLLVVLICVLGMAAYGGG